MDFDDAAQRLVRDQKKIRGRGGNDLAVSAKAKREADFRRKQQAKIKADRERQQRLVEHQKQYMHNCERALKVKQLEEALTPTSIWGEGDKVTLPPSLLEALTSMDQENAENPWTFRIGILNKEYKFPSSPLIQVLKPPEEDQMIDETDSDNESSDKAAYLDELSYKYVSYTHCSVVEFTQEEGYIGIPQLIAEALLDKDRRQKHNKFLIPRTRTVDPAGEVHDDLTETDQERTPGHLAWGEFDIPNLPIEISLVKLPKGRGCTLVPTKEAIQNNFYGLKDVKYVLEQSLTRTRATLGMGDTVSTWHRGVKFDLKVTKIIPAAFHAVTCINTDIEVDIGAAETSLAESPVVPTQKGYTLGTGRSSPPGMNTVRHSLPTRELHSSTGQSVELPPEPSDDQKERVCTIQIRSGMTTGRRRFHTDDSKLVDLFTFAASIAGVDTSSFHLVTTYPRRVFSLGKENISSSLSEAGILPGREQLTMEFL